MEVQGSQVIFDGREKEVACTLIRVEVKVRHPEKLKTIFYCNVFYRQVRQLLVRGLQD